MKACNSRQLKPLAVCMSGFFSLLPLEATCISRIVNNCADSGTGSLRDTVAASNSGDVVDLGTSQLTCSLITLTSGEIVVPQKELTVLGPSDRVVTIANDPNLGGPSNRIFNHTYVGSGGLLLISQLQLTNGKSWSYSSSSVGGCIRSGNVVVLMWSTVSGCSTYTNTGANSKGGAIYALGGVYLFGSSVVGNYTYNVTGRSVGGGIFAHGKLYALRSTISGNTTIARGVFATQGGGAYLGLSTPFDLRYSTIDSNSADGGGGIYQVGSSSASITSSTISGNVATAKGGGLQVDTGKLTINNSTIAFNVAPNYAGIYTIGTHLYAYSSIIARNLNTTAGGFADVFISGGVASFQGAANLVQSYNVTPAQGTVTSNADPRLAPLANHGGPTRTHAPLASSPVIDAGVNSGGLSTDQRGPGFVREVPTGKPDIGAYERQVNDDELFYNGFD